MKIASMNMGRTWAGHAQNMLYTWIVLTVKTKKSLFTQYVLHMFWACSALAIFMYWTCNSMNNLLSYCGLVDTKIRSSDKDLPEKVFQPKRRINVKILRIMVHTSPKKKKTAKNLSKIIVTIPIIHIQESHKVPYWNMMTKIIILKH